MIMRAGIEKNINYRTSAIMLFDEFTFALDPEMINEVIDVMKSL